MIRLSIVVAYLILLVVAQAPSTTNWRGLSPLQSTRMDVERTLGASEGKVDNQQMTYYFHDVVVFISFSGNPKCQKKLPYTSWDVTSDTVTGINVRLRHPLKISETGFDLTKFEKIKGDYDLSDHYVYLNREDGFAVEVDRNYVSGYLYSPGSKQQKPRCERSKQQ